MCLGIVRINAALDGCGPVDAPRRAVPPARQVSTASRRIRPPRRAPLRLPRLRGTADSSLNGHVAALAKVHDRHLSASVNRASGGGFLSHLAAGIVGGALVYGGAAFLRPDGLPGLGERTSRLADVSRPSSSDRRRRPTSPRSTPRWRMPKAGRRRSASSNRSRRAQGADQRARRKTKSLGEAVQGGGGRRPQSDFPSSKSSWR